MNKHLFEAEMKKNGDTIESLSEKIGVSRNTLCAKKNGKVDFTCSEIVLIKSLYNLSNDEVNIIFFE